MFKRVIDKKLWKYNYVIFKKYFSQLRITAP